jgi:hypothetical protein
MMKLKLFSRREDPIEQISKRLSAIESTNGSILEADPAETYERLMRLRHGTAGGASTDLEN